MLKKNELALLTMELETEDLSPEVYRYRTQYGVSVVYFMFDPELLRKYIFEPVYLSPEDVECEGMSEDDIFHAILESTVTIMHTEIIPFSEYFREFEEFCEDKDKLPIIRPRQWRMQRKKAAYGVSRVLSGNAVRRACCIGPCFGNSAKRISAQAC